MRDLQLVGSFEDFFSEACPDLFAQKLDAVHEVLQRRVLVLLAVDQVAAQKSLCVLQHASARGKPEFLRA